ncbi:MAG: discoidin domain-containing protein, partial [Faecalibacillus sp.]
MKKLKIIFIAMTMILSLVIGMTPVYEAYENPNIALGKQATASSTYPDKPWTADKTVDGIIDNTSTKNSRWSSKRLGTGTPSNQYDASEEQWLLVDLESQYTVSQINIFWEGAYATSYKLQGSLDGKTFFDIKTITGNSSDGMKKFNDFEPVQAQYIRVLCQKARNNSWGYSIFEIEIYQNKLLENASDVIHLVENIAPILSEDGKSIILPEVPDGYEISIFGTDNEQVVTKDGKIIKPLVDMDVNLTYKIVKSSDKNDTAVSTMDAKMTIPGQYHQEINENTKPNVVPGLREWKGTTGQFVLDNHARIVYQKDDGKQKEAALLIKTYFKDMLDRDLEVVQGKPDKGDIYLENGTSATQSSIDQLGYEGYYLSIDDYVSIIAPTYKGLIYGGASLTQILYQDKGWNHAPKGLARDYPQYEVRAGMVDVGRMYIPLDYLEEMSVYMSWFKMNEMQVHINDYWGASQYSAFRLESKKYPQINAQDGYYTQEEYRQFQKDMKKYGMDIITEIDTPYHSEAFRNIPGIVMNGSGSLDITTEDHFNANAKIIESLFDEFLDGDDPVIQSQHFHIGTDEYNKSYSEQMRKWTDHFIKYVNNKGKETRLWASLGKNGFNGTTPVTNEATVNLWAPYWADVQETYDAGYDVINTEGGWLYIVPAGNAGYPDRYDTKKIYERFEVNNFKSDRSGTNGTAIMPVAHPQTKGASFAIWNDMTSFKTGFSWFDIYDRMKDAVSIISEKTWFGEDEEEQSYDQFRKRIDALQNKVPNANPGRFVETKGSELIANYDFKTNSNQVLNDTSQNGYHGQIVNGECKNNGLSFHGNGYLSLPIESVGYPYTVSMKVSLDKVQENSILFSGQDGTLYASLDGKIGFKRGDYGFTFDYELKANQEVTLTFVCNQKDTILYINGRKIGNGKLTNQTIGGKAQQSSTLILPTEKIFENVDGTLYELSLYNKAMTDQEVKDLVQYVNRKNLALYKDAKASALEVNDGRFSADKAVDGIVSKDSRVSFARENEQWLLVDLEKEYTIDTIVLDYESAVGKYEIQVSTDGENFTTVYSKNEVQVVGAKAIRETLSFDPVAARYVKYVQKEMWYNNSNGRSYSGSLYEFEVYQNANKELLEKIFEFEEEFNQYESGNHNGQVNQTYYQSMKEMLEKYKALAASEDLTVDAAESAMTTLEKEKAQITAHINYVKQEAIDAYYELDQIDQHHYTSGSYQLMKEQLKKLKDELDNIDNYIDVNEFLDKIDHLKSLLIEVDNSQLIAKIREAKQLNKDNYTNVTELEKILLQAQKVYESPQSQEQIDQMVLSLDQLICSLQLKEADYTKVDEAIKKANALNKDDYKDFSTVEKAIANVQRGLDITKQ